MKRDFLKIVMSYAHYNDDMLDNRGLVPINEAREILNGYESFEGGELLTINGSTCSESDRTFAALCSLENVEEFLKTALNKPWNHPTPMDLICALGQRYGEGLITWLESMIDETNNFPDRGYASYPPHLHDCLLLLSSSEAAELAFIIERPTARSKTPYFLTWLECNPEKETWFIKKVNSGNKRAVEFHQIREKQFASISEVKKILKQSGFSVKVCETIKNYSKL